MQAAVIEFARNKASLERAHSTEFDSRTPNPVIALITEWKTADGAVEVRTAEADVGGTMRLGGQASRLAPNSFVSRAYGTDLINERHRHRYEFNNTYTMDLEAAGMRIAGRSMDGNLVEIVECHPPVVRRRAVPSREYAVHAARWPSAVHGLPAGGAAPSEAAGRRGQ